MLIAAVSWLLLVLHYFLPEPYREQVLALQSIVCVTMPTFDAVHIASLFSLVLYFIHAEQDPALPMIILHHIVVACCILSEYYFHNNPYWTWIILFWCIHWLSTVDAYDHHPIRSAIKFVLFAFVTRLQCVKTLKDGLKWSWILLVHEIGWCALPVQMLYEVYIRETPSHSIV